MMQVAKAALSYWAMVFALGFVLGTARVLWGAEALGETAFLLIEIPVLLVASWLAAQWLVARFGIAQGKEALAMGALAFALLMVAEALLASTMGEGAAQWIAGQIKPPGLYGLAGQIAFGAMPWLAAWRLAKSAQ